MQLIFPDLAANNAYELFYSNVGQHISIANYWNDPFEQDLYFKFSKFLPIINNEVKTLNSSQYKNALLRLNKMILVGGPNDGVITPWESRLVMAIIKLSLKYYIYSHVLKLVLFEIGAISKICS